MSLSVLEKGCGMTCGAMEGNGIDRFVKLESTTELKSTPVDRKWLKLSRTSRTALYRLQVAAMKGIFTSAVGALLLAAVSVNALTQTPIDVQPYGLVRTILPSNMEATQT